MVLTPEERNGMSWIWPEYVNRDLPLNPSQRKAIRRTAWKLWYASRWNIALYLTLPAVYLLAMHFAADAGGRLAALLGIDGFGHKLFRAAAPGALLLICFLGGGGLLQRVRFAPCVYEASRRHGYDICRKCGYWLRGLGDDVERCPECGAIREAAPKTSEIDNAGQADRHQVADD